MNDPAITETKKDKLLSLLKASVKYIPFLILAILMLVAVTTVDFKLKSSSGSENLDSKYLSAMIIMLGITFIVPTLNIERLNSILSAIGIFAFPFCSFFLLEYYTRNPFKDSPIMRDDIMMLNVLVFYFVAFTLIFVTTRTDVALALTSAVPMVFGLANYLALQFRDAPIFPWDLKSAGVAMSVLDNYEVKLTTKLWFIIFSFVFMICFAFLTGFRFKLKKIWMNVAIAVVSFSLTVGFVAYLRTDEAESKYSYYPYLFSSKYLYKYNGTALSFIYTSKYLKLDKPSGYSEKELRELYEKYNEISEPDDIKPNIIVVMNEAFSDLSVLGDFTASSEYMPFINSLNENTIKGNTFVSVKGGNTPNSEFEFLTGTSMAYLPTGSIPFQQYIDSDTMTMVSQLEELGYSTTAMHPYPASGWERNQVYQYFGFDKMYFSPDFSGYDKIRSYYSDLSLYKKIISEYETARESGDSSPQFFFSVTMQNHGSYGKTSNFFPNIEIEELPKDSSSTYREIATYLSLIKKSDEAFEYLVNYFKECDEPTIILMFGDHQPNDYIAKPILKLNGIDDITEEDLKTQQLRWQTPYIMWSNYEIEDKLDLGNTSLNYLGASLLYNAGIPLTSFQRWLTEELYQEYPIINANCFVDKDGVYHSVAEIDSVPILNLYEKLQYNLVFDTQNTIKELFGIAR